MHQIHHQRNQARTCLFRFQVSGYQCCEQRFQFMDLDCGIVTPIDWNQNSTSLEGTLDHLFLLAYLSASFSNPFHYHHVSSRSSHAVANVLFQVVMHVFRLEYIYCTFELRIESHIEWLDKTFEARRNSYYFCLALSLQFGLYFGGLLSLVHVSYQELRLLRFRSKRSSPHVKNPIAHLTFVAPGIFRKFDVDTPVVLLLFICKILRPFPQKMRRA